MSDRKVIKAALLAFKRSTDQYWSDVPLSALMAVVDAVTPIIRANERERIILAILDNPGPDPSPASPAWWAGWDEGRADAAEVVRKLGEL